MCIQCPYRLNWLNNGFQIVINNANIQRSQVIKPMQGLILYDQDGEG